MIEKLELLRECQREARRSLERETDRLREQQQQVGGYLQVLMEIHNHFEKGSSAQVFNDKVTGKFGKLKKWKQKDKNNKNGKKPNRKQ